MIRTLGLVAILEPCRAYTEKINRIYEHEKLCWVKCYSLLYLMPTYISIIYSSFPSNRYSLPFQYAFWRNQQVYAYSLTRLFGFNENKINAVV